jgi:HAMP domain-containing protein
VGSWGLLVLGFLAGVACCAVIAYLGVLRPLRRTAAACARVAAGDVSQTLPEGGPRPLRATATVFNTVLADFQEVLLLFAYFLRSARSSLQGLESRVARAACDQEIRGLVSSVLVDVARMQDMVEGFKYFRVRIESGTIVDDGVVKKIEGRP